MRRKIREMEKMKIAIIGQGRSGRNIHGKFFKSESNDICEVKYIVEQDEFRREKAGREFGCETLSDYRMLFDKKDIDVVLNASYSQTHYDITKDLLNHGFNVLVEKPFARTYYECMDLILTAKKNNVVVTAFHQSLYTPMFLKIKEIIASGKLGDITQINLRYSGYARRWDWQTLQKCCAGSIYNTGPHPIGQALDLLGWDDNAKVAFSSLKTVITSGDAEDYGKIILTALNKPVVDIEVIAADAYGSDHTFKIYGTNGTLMATNAEYKMKYIDPTVLPERPVIFESISNADGDPAYCSEKLEFIEENEKVTGSAFDSAVKTYYKMLYNTVMLGKDLDITPEKAAKVIGVIEACHAENPLPLKY